MYSRYLPIRIGKLDRESRKVGRNWKLGRFGMLFVVCIRLLFCFWISMSTVKYGSVITCRCLLFASVLLVNFELNDTNALIGFMILLLSDIERFLASSFTALMYAYWFTITNYKTLLNILSGTLTVTKMQIKMLSANIFVGLQRR